MQNFVIVGITGIGKTFLELELEAKHGFYPWPKYTDRAEQRKGETSTSNIKFVSSEVFNQMQTEFLYTLTYLGNRYGWRRSDLADNKGKKNITLAIPLDSLVDFMNRVPGFLPVMLHIDLENFQLIENRIKEREDFENLPLEKKKLVNEKVQERLIAARYELEKVNFYQKIVQRYGGQIFNIKDNNTIYQDVIPYMLASQKVEEKKESFSDIANKYR